MKIISTSLFVIGLFCLSISCKNSSSKKELYVFSKDTVNIYFDCYRRHDTACLNKLNPVPLPPPGFDWYSDLVVIFDSTDKVYLYQTKKSANFDSNANIEYPIYPNYIGLRPYQLISFSSKIFINFIKDNNDIFELDTINRKYNRLIYIVSNKDTIENKAYYDLIDLITPQSEYQKQKWKVCFMRRMTTEEEDTVIYYKRKNVTFNPETIKWSNKFINGHCSPFTKDYDSIEKKMFYIIKSNDTYLEECTKLSRIL